MLDPPLSLRPKRVSSIRGIGVGYTVTRTNRWMARTSANCRGYSKLTAAAEALARIGSFPDRASFRRFRSFSFESFKFEHCLNIDASISGCIADVPEFQMLCCTRIFSWFLGVVLNVSGLQLLSLSLPTQTSRSQRNENRSYT